MRRCREGFKIGPLFADDVAVAATLLDAFAGLANGEPTYIDVPDNDAAASALVEGRGMEQVFGCARMYMGAFPDLAHDRVFGVTSFEFG